MSSGLVDVNGFKLMRSESFFNFGAPAIEMHDKKIEAVTQKLAPQGHNIGVNNWLPAAAPHYMISPNIKDYVLTPIPAFFNDLPNTNGEAAPLEYLNAFSTEHGQLAYKTFIGMPAHEEHANRDIRKAKGVIFDIYRKRVKNAGNGKIFKFVMLVGYDRTKDPALVESILRGDVRTYSMGYYYGAYTCSICGNTVSSTEGRECEHTYGPSARRGGKPTYQLSDGRLVYRNNHFSKGFEMSSVSNPAYALAQSDVVWDMRQILQGR